VTIVLAIAAWLEFWFDMSTSVRYLIRPSLPRATGVQNIAPHGRPPSPTGLFASPDSEDAGGSEFNPLTRVPSEIFEATCDPTTRAHITTPEIFNERIKFSEPLRVLVPLANLPTRLSRTEKLISVEPASERVETVPESYKPMVFSLNIPSVLPIGNQRSTFDPPGPSRRPS
jgi:hypothetical protein